MFRRSLPLLLLLLACASRPALAGATATVPYRFAPGEEISLRVEEGLITLRSIRFRASESKLQASVLAFCDEGKDQIVELEITLLDAGGRTVGVLSGKGSVEEEQKARIKVAGSVPPDLQPDIQSFQVAVWSRPD